MKDDGESNRSSSPFGADATALLVGVLTLCTAIGAHAAQKEWPTGKSPIEVGNKVAEYVLGNAQPYGKRPSPVTKPTLLPDYASACSFYGMLIYADQTKNRGLLNKVIEAYEPYRTGKELPYMGHGDNNVFGMIPLELYRQTGKGEYLAMGRVLAEEGWDRPRKKGQILMVTNPRKDGLSKFTRWWLDDPYVIGALQAHAYKNSGDIEYINRGARLQLAYFKRLRQPNGLFHHRVPEWRVAWSRGSGWATAGMAEMLLAMPADHPLREKLMQEYLLTIDTLIKFQKDTGMWGEYLDVPDALPESSCTGMFVFAIAHGVCEGWLPDKRYRQVAERAWLALTDYVDEKGAVRNVSNFAPDGIPKRFKPAGDMHGQCAVLWAATAMIRMNNGTQPSCESENKATSSN